MSMAQFHKRDRLYDRCMYKDCPNGKFNRKRLFRFPISTDPRHDTWLRNTGNPHLKMWSKTTVRSSGLCEDHFRPESFVDETRTRLKRLSVPIPYYSETKTGKSNATLRSVTTVSRNDDTLVRSIKNKDDIILQPVVNKSNGVESTIRSRPLLSNNKIRTFESTDSTNYDIVTEIVEIIYTPCKVCQEKELCSVMTQTDPEIIEKVNFDQQITIRCQPRSLSNTNDACESIVIESDGTKYEREEKFNINKESNKSLGTMEQAYAKARDMEKVNEHLHLKVLSYKRTMRRLRIKLKRAEHRMSLLKRLTKRRTVDDFLDENDCIEPAARAMVKLQLHRPDAQYSQTERDLAQELYFYSTKAYKGLCKAGCKLPTINIVKRWFAEFGIKPKFLRSFGLKNNKQLLSGNAELSDSDDDNDVFGNEDSIT